MRANDGFTVSLQKIIFPILAIILLSLHIFNHFCPIKHLDNAEWRIRGQLTLFSVRPAI